MTELVAELRELLGKVTPGPWTVDSSIGVCRILDIATVIRWMKYKTSAKEPYLATTSESGLPAYADLARTVAGKSLANAQLIAAAVNALPELLSELERLQAKYEPADSDLPSWEQLKEGEAQALEGYGRLMAENSRLRAALDEAAKSLETLAVAGDRDERWRGTVTLREVRGYASSRADVARRALEKGGDL